MKCKYCGSKNVSKVCDPITKKCHSICNDCGKKQ